MDTQEQYLPPEQHFSRLARRILSGVVTPFLGVGVNLCENRNRERRPPSGLELAGDLAQWSGYPAPACAPCLELPRVSQFADVAEGPGALYEKLRGIFEAQHEPTRVHHFLASIPSLLREKNCASKYQLIVTTNYDDLLETAFAEANEPFDLVSYITLGEHVGKFRHIDPAGNSNLIYNPNDYKGLDLQKRTVILKIHGAIDRQDASNDSYVITEDHYIQYLSRPETLTKWLPASVAARLCKSHLLFLGYSLQDWNLRVFLHRLSSSGLNWNSWAVQLRGADPSGNRWWEYQSSFWRRYNVELIGADVGAYVDELATCLKRTDAS